MIHNVDPQLSQWDVGRSVSISDSNATHIHFANQGDSKAVIIEIKDGSAKIPDYLLQTGKTVIAYAVLDGVTLESKSYSVRKRERPENYIYEDDQRNYIYELITDTENAVKNANLAVEYANTAGASAIGASNNANQAANSANEAASMANAAAESANLASSKANVSADGATVASNNANLAAAKANTAADNANNATQNASLAASNANTATESANIATANANESAENATEASNNANQAARNANDAAVKAAHTAKSLMVIGKEEGALISLDDAIEQYLVGLRVFGKTTQDGTPTPDNPVELVSTGASGAINTTVRGANLVPGLAEGKTYTRNGLTLKVYADRCVCSGTPSATYAQVYIASLKDILQKGVYRVAGGENGDGKVYLQVIIERGGKTTYLIQDKTFQIYGDEDDVRVTIQTGTSTATVNNYVFYPIVHVGSTPIPYEPYKAQTLTATAPNSLPGIPVTSGGNYTDANGQQWICDEIDFAKGVYVKRVGVLVLDAGSARWKDGIFSSGSAHYIYLDDPSVVIDKGSLFTHATYELNGILADNKYCSSGAGYFQVVTDLTLDEWRAYLTEQNEGGVPISLLYSLQNYEETPLSEEELAAYANLHTYKGNTTVTNDAGAWMDLEYVMDAKKYIDSVITGTILPARVE